MGANRECGGKRQHADKSSALNHRAALIRKGAWPGKMWAYECKWCHYWHVGHRRRP